MNRLIFYRGGSSECPICLDPLRRGFVTPCQHRFHCACLRRHMTYSHACPMCRAPLPGDTAPEDELLLTMRIHQISALRVWLRARRIILEAEAAQERAAETVRAALALLDEA